MVTSLKIGNFKLFRSLELSSLKRVNLITGKNSTGKTALLEAIFIAAEPQQTGKLAGLFREGSVPFGHPSSQEEQDENVWFWLLHNRQPAAWPNFHLSGAPGHSLEVWISERKDVEPHSIESTGPRDHEFIGLAQSQKLGDYRRRSNPLFNVTAVGLPAKSSAPFSDAKTLDRVALDRNRKRRLIELLQDLEPRLTSLETNAAFGPQLIYADVGLPQMIPIIHLGQGFQRLLSLYAAVLSSGKKIVLIDEIENGLHHSIHGEVWRGLGKLAEQEDVQIFATTHSWECAAAAHLAFAETTDYDFAVHRLAVVDEDVKVQTLDREAMEAAVEGFIEVR